MPLIDTAFSDREYLKIVTRKLLGRIEASLDTADLSAQAEQKSHELIFGIKASLAATLVTVAELLLSLEIIPNQEGNGRAMAELPLSSADVALVEAFVRKIKQAPILTSDLFS